MYVFIDYLAALVQKELQNWKKFLKQGAVSGHSFFIFFNKRDLSVWILQLRRGLSGGTLNTFREWMSRQPILSGFREQAVKNCPVYSPVRYVLKIHFFIEFGLKMIQFKIQFKTKSKVFIRKNIHSNQNPKYSFKKNIHSIESRIFNRIIHS